MASIRQIEANRLNAQKSTGPTSPEGKAASSMNALQSGIDSKALLIRGERRQDLDALTGAYHQRFQPLSPDEFHLVDTLVASEWLLRRLRKTELVNDFETPARIN